MTQQGLVIQEHAFFAQGARQPVGVVLAGVLIDCLQDLDNFVGQRLIKCLQRGCTLTQFGRLNRPFVEFVHY